MEEASNTSASSTTEAIPMSGGDGRNSYVNNSSLQRMVVDRSKLMIDEAISEYLDIPSVKTFRIVDFGCSVGPNTFIAMQNIVEAVSLKCSKSKKLTSSTTPEFHVFFNDHTTNDFNNLFVSLPPGRRYFASGVPGSFHTRLFPKDTIHIAYSTNSLHWLSQVPTEVVNKNSPAYNKGRIHYTNARHEVFQAYSARYAKDLEAFLCARAEEMVRGGLMVLSITATPDETPPSQSLMGSLFDILGSCLMDMARMGIVEEAKVDSFNVPVYSTSPQEMKELVKRNGCFSLERVDIPLSENNQNRISAQTYSDHMRAVMEGLIKSHFGCDEQTVDHIFKHLYPRKVEDTFSVLSNSLGRTIVMFILLKRNDNVAH